MKKIIAAAAGLMLVGSVVSASAAIEFSGDARARYEFHDNYQGDDANDDQWNNRVRLKIKGTTAGGSWAKFQMTMGNSPWGSNDIQDTAATIKPNVDYAFVGVPMGCVLLNAGRQPLNLTTTYFNDAAVDNVRVTYASEGTTLIGLYGVYGDDGIDKVTNSNDELYSGVWTQAWNDSWATTLGMTYINLQQTADSDAGGFVGVIAVNGDMGAMDLNFELGYQEEGLAATDAKYKATNVEDAIGAYLAVGYDISEEFKLTGVAAYAQEGFVFDAPVGFMMLGGDSQLTINDHALSAYGDDDLYLIGLKGAYQATADLGFSFNLGYVDFGTEDDAFEVSAQAAYAINDGTMIYGRTGYVSQDNMSGGAEDDAFGFGVSLELSF